MLKAQELRSVSELEKRTNLVQLTLGALENVVELSLLPGLTGETKKRYNSFITPKTEEQRLLSYALRNKLGSAKHYALLFFILGYEAHLGSHHYLEFGEVSFTSNHKEFNIHVPFNRVDDYNCCLFIGSWHNQDEMAKKGFSMDLVNKRIQRQENTPFYSYHLQSSKNLVITKGIGRHVSS